MNLVQAAIAFAEARRTLETFRNETPPNPNPCQREVIRELEGKVRFAEQSLLDIAKEIKP